MSEAGKMTAAISGAFLLLIVVAIILIATSDWNRLKPTINQKVSAELNRPFAIVAIWAWCGSGKNKKLAGVAGCRGLTRSRRHHSRRSTGYSRSHDGAFAASRGNAGTAGAADQTGLAAVDQARKARRAPGFASPKRTITGRLISPTMITKTRMQSRRHGRFGWIIFFSIKGGSSLMTK